MRRYWLVLCWLGSAAARAFALQGGAAPPPSAAAQNPSPMVEESRSHERLKPRSLGGITRSFIGPAAKPVELWIPERALEAERIDLVIHFHGAAWLPQQAVARLDDGRVSATLNLGSGGSTYGRPFADPTTFDSLLSGIVREVANARAPASMARPSLGAITLTGWSAGYGAIRAILREPRHFARVQQVLLLDGIHTGYLPEGSVLATGGALDTVNLAIFAEFARAAVRGEKRFVITHSEIFPGTFASTTECTNWLLRSIGVPRRPVLLWGPRGLQQTSAASAGGFELIGYAGNSAPDHVDQLHALPELLARMLRAPTAPFDPRFVGSWRLEARTDSSARGVEPADGPLGARPIALLFYDAAGNVSAQLMAPDRGAGAVPKRTAPRRQSGSAVDPNNSAASDGYDAYFGRATFDEKAGTVTHELVGALSPADVGRRLVRHVAFRGDTLVLSFDTKRGDGRVVTRRLFWLRTP